MAINPSEAILPEDSEPEPNFADPTDFTRDCQLLEDAWSRALNGAKAIATFPYCIFPSMRYGSALT